MDMIGTLQGTGNGYDDPGSVTINVTDEWEIELVVEGRDGGSTARVFLAFDPGVNSIVALALLALQAERRVGELVAAAQVFHIARRLGVNLEENHTKFVMVATRSPVGRSVRRASARWRRSTGDKGPIGFPRAGGRKQHDVGSSRG